jgi:hypothetical protein
MDYRRRRILKQTDKMNENLRKEIDAVIQEICQINDLNIKADLLTYMERQAAFLLWQIEEDLRVDQNMKNI